MPAIPFNHRPLAIILFCYPSAQSSIILPQPIESIIKHRVCSSVRSFRVHVSTSECVALQPHKFVLNMFWIKVLSISLSWLLLLVQCLPTSVLIDSKTAALRTGINYSINFAGKRRRKYAKIFLERHASSSLANRWLPWRPLPFLLQLCDWIVLLRVQNHWIWLRVLVQPNEYQSTYS